MSDMAELSADRSSALDFDCDGRIHAANRQRKKIKQIGKTLRAAGFVSLNEQARALGLPRSTTWTLLQADHKTSGLHAALIGRKPPPRAAL